MDNPEELATYVIDRRKTTQYVLDTTLHKQTQITQIKHEFSYKQLEVKTNRTYFFMWKS